MMKKIFRIFLNPILVVLLFILYLYFIVYSAMSYFSLKNVIRNIDISGLYEDNLNIGATKITDMISDTTKTVMINTIYKKNYSSRDVLNLVNKNVDDTLGSILSSLPAVDELKSTTFLELNNLKNEITDVKDTETASTIIDICNTTFSKETCNILIGVTAVILMILLILNSSFKWIRINSVVMFLSSLFYLVVSNILLSGIPTIVKNINVDIIRDNQNLIVNIFNDIFSVVKQGFSISIFFIILSIITFVMYFTVFKPRVNKLK